MKTPLKRNDLIYPELSYQLVGYAYEIFDELGLGHSEKTYQNSFSSAIINQPESSKSENV